MERPSKSGSGSNGSIEWDTFILSKPELSEFISAVSMRDSGAPSRHRSKWYVANDFLGIFTKISPWLIETKIDNMFPGPYHRVSIHTVRSVRGPIQEVYISAEAVPRPPRPL